MLPGTMVAMNKCCSVWQAPVDFHASKSPGRALRQRLAITAIEDLGLILSEDSFFTCIFIPRLSIVGWIESRYLREFTIDVASS